MSNIAQKLTYLNDTKSLLKDSINSLGGNITSQTTFRQYVTELDSIYSSLPKVSGSGTNINLSPTKVGRITSQINGDTQQDGTPTPDSPVEVQTVTGLQKVTISGGTGTTPQEYEINLGNIHLYENDQIIGTPDNWSIKHVMGEVVLDGSENWNMLGSIYNYFQYTPTNLNQNTSDANPMSNYFIKNTAWNERKRGIWFDRNLIIKTNESLNLTQSLSDFKTWLSTHNTKVVYELAEPTTEPITNTELIEDLNNFYNKAKSYNGQTNISVEGDLQMILDVSAIKGE